MLNDVVPPSEDIENLNSSVATVFVATTLTVRCHLPALVCVGKVMDVNWVFALTAVATVVIEVEANTGCCEPLTVAAFRLATSVVLATVSGAVPVATVEASWLAVSVPEIVTLVRSEAVTAPVAAVVKPLINTWFAVPATLATPPVAPVTRVTPETPVTPVTPVGPVGPVVPMVPATSIFQSANVPEPPTASTLTTRDVVEYDVMRPSM